MSDYKVKVVSGDEEPTIAEKEEQVLESAGVKVDDNTYKIDLSKTTKTEENAVQEQSTDESVLRAEQPEVELQEVGEGNKEPEVATEPQEEVDSPLQLVTDEEEVVLENANDTVTEEEIKEVLEDQKIELPENIQKVVDFMNETGGSLEDYVRLNTDYSNIDEQTLLREYYKQTKPHLDNEEINFLLEDTFSYDEDEDEERDIKRKKLAYKEELSKAISFLDDLKGKYYDEVKSTSRLLPEQKEAIEFYNKYKQEQDELTARQQKASESFTMQTEKLFNQEFKGFDFKVGDNKFRLKVSDVEGTKKAQSNIVEAFKTFLDDNNTLKDPNGYHKALYAARNADSLANHFYEQGKADALKQLEAESKNINMDPRKTSSGFVDAGGLKVRAISGDSSSKLRVKIKQ